MHGSLKEPGLRWHDMQCVQACISMRSWPTQTHDNDPHKQSVLLFLSILMRTSINQGLAGSSQGVVPTLRDHMQASEPVQVMKVLLDARARTPEMLFAAREPFM